MVLFISTGFFFSYRSRVVCVEEVPTVEVYLAEDERREPLVRHFFADERLQQRRLIQARTGRRSDQPHRRLLLHQAAPNQKKTTFHKRARQQLTRDNIPAESPPNWAKSDTTSSWCMKMKPHSLRVVQRDTIQLSK